VLDFQRGRPVTPEDQRSSILAALNFQLSLLNF